MEQWLTLTDKSLNGHHQTIELINDLKAKLFDRDIYDGYLLGLRSDAYAYYVSSLTSVLKYETRAGIEGVDMGQIAEAYGVSAFQINANVLKGANKEDTGVVGYFANEVGTVGDTFWSSMTQYNGNYPKFPGLTKIKNFIKSLFLNLRSVY